MLTRVEVRTRQGTLLNLPLEDVTSGYILTEVEGLDPVKATLVSSSFANQDGAQYQSSRRESRNLKLKLELEPDYINNTVESLRLNLYDYLMPKTEVDLRLVRDDGLEVDITGMVESHEAPMFVKEPAVDVSLMCFKPDFIDPTPVEFSGTSTELTTETDIVYAGNIETGFILTLNLNRDESAITVYLRAPNGSLSQLDFAASLLDGDKLVISTVSGSKGAWLTRAGVESSILYGIPPQSGWPYFVKGTNKLRIYATGSPAIPYTIEYMTRYGGL
jgi:hypothetical protein